MKIPNAAIEAATKSGAHALRAWPNWRKRTEREVSHVVLEAAMPAIREALAQEIEARSQNMTGGVGIGMSIAASIVRGDSE